MGQNTYYKGSSTPRSAEAQASLPLALTLIWWPCAPFLPLAWHSPGRSFVRSFVRHTILIESPKSKVENRKCVASLSTTTPTN